MNLHINVRKIKTQHDIQTRNFSVNECTGTKNRVGKPEISFLKFCQCCCNGSHTMFGHLSMKCFFM